MNKFGIVALIALIVLVPIVIKFPLVAVGLGIVLAVFIAVGVVLYFVPERS